MSRPILSLAALLLLTALPAGGQAPEVETNLPADGYIDRDATIDLSFTGPLGADRIAVLVGATDLTDLFRRTAGGMTYTPGPVPLPSGEQEMVIYRVDAEGAWTELKRVKIRVRNRAGFDRTDFDPGVTLGLAGPLGGGRDPADPSADDGFHQELTGKLQVESELVRNGTRVASTATVVGTSDRKTALRFGEKGADATRVDLSTYQLRFTRDRWQMSLGHLTQGDQRHLIRSFDSRGTQLSLTPHPRLSATAAVMNGSRVVGWDNPLGLDRPEHRIVSASVGLEVLPRAGALRVEMTGLDGSVLPVSSYDRGSITDAETSRGLGVRVRASTAGRRLTLDAGLARSAFDNPVDPALAQGESLVPVRRETRTARYLETGVGLLQGIALGGGRRADLSLAYRHERVDPLYRSVATYIRSDVAQNSAELRGTVAGLGVRLSWNGSENNLDRIRSILTTRTRRRGLDASLPMATVLGVDGRGGPWLPTLRYAVDRTHQRGLGVPDEGGFDASHVPDQVSTNRTATADWRWSRVSLGIQVGHVHQDNRQPGREEADFTTRTRAATLGLPLHSRISVNLSAGREEAERHESGRIDRTRRYAAGATWTPLQRAALNLNLASTRGDDNEGLREQDNLQVDVQWSAAVPWLRALSGSYFLRGSRALAGTIDREFQLDQERESWAASSGLTFTF